jgi:DNA-dependent protein kinase catalytic subunit
LVVLDYLKVVWHRLQQFTDELLASCLRLILAYPVEFFDITELITPLEKALRLGITYHPLATIAMNSLDKLMDPDLNYDIDSYFLSRILPCINEYLLVGVVSFGEEEGQHGKKKSYKTPTASQRRYQSVRIKMTSDQLGVIKRNYADLPELQKRMMRFLGRLGGKNKQLLLEGKSSIQDNGMLAWDPERKLKLRVPFMNVKVDIYLDEYLPRICELAESSPDRKVKVAACELLHGLVIYMIGNSAFQAKTTQKATESLYHKFYLRVFPVMLRLAIDPDQIAREMYQLLYSQIIHWLTNNAHAENPETIELLQTFLDAACSTDAGLRDYGAECIQEFVKWSIKQTTRSTDATHNIKSLITRLYNLMVNPSASKRFGASLIFNHIYRLFREEASLVNLYTFEILGQLLVSLKIAEADHPSIGTQGQIIEAINHIKRIIREKSNIFLTENDRHSFIGEVTVRNLYQLVQWTFEESGSFQRTYAKVCMTLFTEFAILLPDIKSCSHWLSKELCLNPLSLVNIFETEQLQTPSLVDDESHAISKYLSWIKRLNATIDGYIWLIEREVIDPLELLQLPSSMFLVSLSFFIRNTPYDYLEEKLDQSPVEKNKIMSIYTHNAMRLIYFLDLVIRSPKNGNRSFQYLERIFADTLYHNNLTDMISTALIMPKQTSETIEAYHGNAITQSSVARILDISRNFITTMLERSSPKFMDSLALSISKVLKYKKVNMLFIEGVDIGN